MTAALVPAVVACVLGSSHLARGAQSPVATSMSRVDPAAAATAERAYTALRRRFALGRGLYAASDTRHSYAHVWPLSQALAAELALGALPIRGAAAARRDALQTIQALAHYRRGQGYNSTARPPLDRGGQLYYDDNNWLALDLLAGYRMFGKQSMLKRAEGVFTFLVSGWDRKTGDACPGGIYWARPPLRQIRTTVSTANAAIAALRLYRATGKRTYLTWGKRMYDWVDRCLAAPDGLYYDHLDAHGDVDKREWTYNQGSMVAAGVLLAQATGEHSYLDRAWAGAKAALAHFRASRYKGDPATYVAIYFDGLDVLQQRAPVPGFRGELRRYLKLHVKLRPDGHFGTTPLHQAAAVRLYALAAALS